MIAVFLANGFEEIEALGTVDILRRADLEVVTIGIGGSRAITGAHGMMVAADIDDVELKGPAELGVEAVVLPGGIPGATNLDKSPDVDRYLTYCAAEGKWIFAICAAPLVLGHRGLIDGKRVTCYPGYEGELGGAQYTGALVERDDRFITGKGPGATFDFAFTIVEALCGREKADELRDGMQCRS